MPLPTVPSLWGDWPLNALHLHIIGIGGHFVHCLPSGKGIETFFRLGGDGYRGDLGKKSMGREPGSWRISVESDWISEQGLPALKER